MASEVKPIPDGCEGATPYLCVNGASAAIEFYKKAFGATEVYRMMEPSGKIGHAEIRVGRAVIMLADEYPELGHRGPKSLGGTTCDDSPLRRRRGRGLSPGLLRRSENIEASDRTSSTAIATANWKTLSVTFGSSQPARKRCRLKRY